MQIGETACDDTDMRLGRFQRADAEVAGEADTVDDMSGRPASRQKCWQRGSRYRMHHLILAFQPGDQRRTDEAAGAEYL